MTQKGYNFLVVLGLLVIVIVITVITIAVTYQEAAPPPDPTLPAESKIEIVERPPLKLFPAASSPEIAKLDDPFPILPSPEFVGQPTPLPDDTPQQKAQYLLGCPHKPATRVFSLRIVGGDTTTVWDCEPYGSVDWSSSIGFLHAHGGEEEVCAVLKRTSPYPITACVPFDPKNADHKRWLSLLEKKYAPK